jgi:peptidoglycan hydrolase-like protein with peptidoglycan-binding domain
MVMSRDATAKTTCPHNGAVYDAVATRRVSTLIFYCASVFHCALSGCTTFKTFASWCWESRSAPRDARSFALTRSRGMHMPNPGQPTISAGATGEAVRRLQRALRRTPNLGLVVDGVFGPATEAAVKDFQQGAGLVVDGIVGPQTWAALPSGAPMPTLQEGSTGAVVTSLQQLLSNGASGQWNTSPGAIDGNFGPATAASVKAFQTWGGVTADGIVGDQTWAVSLHAASATLESAVGLQYAV